MTAPLGVFLCFCALNLSGNQRTIDPMDFPDDAAARRVWTTSLESEPVAMVQDGGRRAMRIDIPFASKPDLSRVSIDRQVALDLSAPGEFRLDLACDPPDAANAITLYFRSGKGWYSAGRGVAKPGWQTLVFPKSSFRPEDKPMGWHKIDAIRISVWRGQAMDATLCLGGLTSLSQDVAIVIPNEDTKETKSSRETADVVLAMVEQIGMGADRIEESTLTHGALADRLVVILPYNPSLSAHNIDALVAFVQRGGKVLSCYALPPKLGAALGFAQGKYVKEERKGRFAEIRFDAPDVVGLPKSVRQASWNIVTATPKGHHAREIGRWLDADGKPTGDAAMLLSDRGAFLSHVILPDDRDGKKQLLAAVLGHLAPSLWKAMAACALRQADHVGHCGGLDEVAAHVRAQKMPSSEAILDAAARTLAEAKKQFDAGAYYQAIQLARQGHEQLADAYLRAQPSPTREARAWWSHSSTGVYPGDWDRTARELAEAGFNMILPNMCWAGSADYASDVLPRSETFRKYGDQIAQCVAAAKKHGLEVHVWKVNHFLWHNTPKDFCEKLRAQGRLQVSARGKPINWLCPSHPENFKLELESMVEVARKYDVDGLHFDYIRYPDREWCFCDGCRTRFEATSGRKVNAWPDDCYRGERRAEYNDWRCQQITRLVAAVSREAKRVRPGVKISAAVFGNYPACRESVAQDWPAWIKAGYLDFLCPMDYSANDAEFSKLVTDQLRLIDARVPVYPGIGATATDIELPPDRVVGQIHLARSAGASGFTIFNLSPATAKTILPAVKLSAGAQKATPPHRGEK